MRVRVGNKVVVVPDDIGDEDLSAILDHETGTVGYQGKPDEPLEEDLATTFALARAFSGPVGAVLGGPAAVVGRGALAGGGMAAQAARRAAPVVGKQIGKRLAPAGVSVGLWELLQSLRGKK